MNQIVLKKNDDPRQNGGVWFLVGGGREGCYVEIVGL